VIGLASGTSMDGIDAAVAELRLTGGTIELIPLAHQEITYPGELRAALLDVLAPASGTAAELCRLDAEVGTAFATVAESLHAGHGAGLVVTLGQPVHHEGPSALRLGQPTRIAERTGLPVVSVPGGHDVGAALDRLWLAGSSVTGEPVAALDLGWAAGLTVVSPDRPALAFDTGPGTVLLDAAARMISDGVWQRDVDGELASQGSVRPDLLGALLADVYYVKSTPKFATTGYFHAGYLRTALEGIPYVPAVDLLATLVELTAVTVADARRAHDAGRVIVSGGGVRNPALIAALRRALHPVPVLTSDELGLPTGTKEAYAAALLGFQTWFGTPDRPAAGITPGRQPLRLPDPVTTAATELRVHSSQRVG
jgi:anhydro-N-acetylmuramic acid kinase